MNRRIFTRTTVTALLGALLSLSGIVPTQALATNEYWQAHDQTSADTIDHSYWTSFLDRYVIKYKDRVNRVRYAQVRPADKGGLDAYVKKLESVEITQYNRDEQRAYWINLYNAVTVQQILEHYPVASIRDIRSGFFSSGPWKKELITVEGITLTLDNIEHDILRPIWQDPRIHYAVNCASIGCPNLQMVAFDAGNTDALLDQGAFEFINHPRGAWVSNGNLRVSSIYDWFQEDFGNTEQGVIEHIRQYADEELTQRLAGIEEIDSYEYDWTLNGLVPVKRTSNRVGS
ncbi:MAG: DUF547 domain-containing protein [Pseudomonadota bacterium]